MKNRMNLKHPIVIALLVLLINAAASSSAFAQGEDGTSAERNLLIILEMLAGDYDNANQSYFDQRLKKPEALRHSRKHVSIERVDEPALGENGFQAQFTMPGSESEPIERWFTLEVDYESDSVRMKAHDCCGKESKPAYQPIPQCDILWREEAGQFHGRLESNACKDKTLARDMLLSEDALWVSLSESADNHYQLERARNFSCYVDVPGVGGGRDIPYKRYQIEKIHDRGGQSWITLSDGTQVSVSLRNVKWPMNNLRGVFTRHSMVMYISQRDSPEQEAKEVSYTWSSPDAQRIGMNLKWMLANCYMISNEDVTPYFKDEPRL